MSAAVEGQEVMLDFEGQTPATELGGFVPIDDGVYDARITKSELKRTRDTNRPMVVHQWTIASGEFAGKTINYDNVVFSKGGVRFILARMVALGLQVPKRVSAEELAVLYARDSLGKIAQITVAQGKPNAEGKTFPEVRGIAPASFPDTGGEAADLPTVEEDAF